MEDKDRKNQPKVTRVADTKRKLLTKVYLTDEESSALLNELGAVMNAYVNRLIDAGVGIGYMGLLTLHGTQKSPLQKNIGRVMMVGNHLAQLQIFEMLERHSQIFEGQEEVARRRMAGRVLSDIVQPEPPLRHITKAQLDRIVLPLTEEEMKISRLELDIELQTQQDAQEGADPLQS